MISIEYRILNMEIIADLQFENTLTKIQVIPQSDTDLVEIKTLCIDTTNQNQLNDCSVILSPNEVISLSYLISASVFLDSTNGDGYTESNLYVFSEEEEECPQIIVEKGLGEYWRINVGYAETEHSQGIDLNKDECLQLIQILKNSHEHAINVK